MWRTFEDTFGEILNDLERHTALIDSEANAAHIAASWRDQAENQKDRERRQLHYIKDWLTPAFPEVDQKRFIQQRLRYSTTAGTWLLEKDAVRSWLDVNNHASPLWLTGIPGSGMFS